jgi:hypothetical protein
MMPERQPEYPPEYDQDEEPICEREQVGLGKGHELEWWCLNDVTGCIWNDGNNSCMAPDKMGISPVDDPE